MKDELFCSVKNRLISNMAAANGHHSRATTKMKKAVKKYPLLNNSALPDPDDKAIPHQLPVRKLTIPKA